MASILPLVKAIFLGNPSTKVVKRLCCLRLRHGEWDGDCRSERDLRRNLHSVVQCEEENCSKVSVCIVIEDVACKCSRGRSREGEGELR